MTQLHIAVAQITARCQNLAGNLARIERQTHAAAINGCEVVLFAEVSCHAYVFTRANLELAEEAGTGPACSEIIRLAVRHRIAVSAGFLERSNQGFHNSHICARPDGTWFVARKTELTGVELEAGLVRGDGQFRPFVLKGVPIAMVICADGGHPELNNRMRAQGIRFRFCPTAGGDCLFGEKQPPMREADLATPEGQARYAKLRSTVFDARSSQDRSSDPLCGFASANACGDDGNGTHHLGHAMIVDNDLVLRAQIPGTPVIEHKHDQMVHAIVTVWIPRGNQGIRDEFIWGVATISNPIEGAHAAHSRGESVWNRLSGKPVAIKNGNHGEVNLQSVPPPSLKADRLPLNWSRLRVRLLSFTAT